MTRPPVRLIMAVALLVVVAAINAAVSKTSTGWIIIAALALVFLAFLTIVGNLHQLSRFRHRGTSAASTRVSAATRGEATSTLEFTRTDGLRRDGFRAYKIFIDGSHVAAIQPGQTIGCPVDAGHHVAQVRIAWCRSPEAQVTLVAGQTARFECWPDINVEALAAITVSRNQYLKLASVP
jgi:hypothetical protein